jgi:hypothetical protein
MAAPSVKPSRPKAPTPPPPKPRPKAPTPAPVSRNKSRSAPAPSRNNPPPAPSKSATKAPTNGALSSTKTPTPSRSGELANGLSRAPGASPASSRGFSGLTPAGSPSVSRQGQGFQMNQGMVNSGNVTNSGNYSGTTSYINNSVNYTYNGVTHTINGPGGGSQNPGFPSGPNGFSPGGVAPGGFNPPAPMRPDLSGLRGNAIVNTGQLPDGTRQTETFYNGVGTQFTQGPNGNQLRISMPNGETFSVPDRSPLPATDVAQNPTNPVPAGLGASPADTLVQGRRAIDQLNGNIGRLDATTRNFATDYNNAFRTGGQAAADQFLAGVPENQRDAVRGAGQSMRRLSDLEAAYTAAQGGLPPSLNDAGRTAYNDFQRLRGLDPAANPTFNDALTAMRPVNDDVRRFGATDRDRINLGRGVNGQEGTSLRDRIG